jgi:hypothetical protein
VIHDKVRSTFEKTEPADRRADSGGEFGNRPST